MQLDTFFFITIDNKYMKNLLKLENNQCHFQRQLKLVHHSCCFLHFQESNWFVQIISASSLALIFLKKIS